MDGTNLIAAELQEYRTLTASMIEQTARLKLLRQADRIHRFPAKMFPQLAYSFLREVTGKLDEGSVSRLKFHDPMCGSSTTALAARSLGLKVTASDFLYPAVMISRAKLWRLDDAEARELAEFGRDLELSGKSGPLLPWPNWQLWFTRKVLRSLEELAEAVNERRRTRIFPHLVTSLFQTIWDASAADKRVAVPTRSVFSRVPPNLGKKEILSLFRQRTHRILVAQDALSKLDLSYERPSVAWANALDDNEWPEQRIDVILTSPPYGCGLDYGRAFRLQMRLWNRFINQTAPAGLPIGRTTYLEFPSDDLPPSEHRARWYRYVSKANEHRFRMLLRYLHDFRGFLRLSRRHLSKKGRLCLVIGNPQISRCAIPLGRIINKMAVSEGFELELRPRSDTIRTRSQNFRLRSATDHIGEEFMFCFGIS